ncbi:winged helix-turn-helix transcriptional regulator [Thermogymnomonas acidicola]|uniref:MarR family transcriptional regulator n=1 Tax=Thermogymnomonas acidicola TaxID=399579 RepID=UPI0009465D22|nr:MarR family transcriptional regulator [Thermogymnomonas acidicola]
MQQDPPRKAILLMLRQAEERGIDQSELQGRTGYSKSRLSEILTSLEREGRIVRQTTGGVKRRGYGSKASSPMQRSQ